MTDKLTDKEREATEILFAAVFPGRWSDDPRMASEREQAVRVSRAILAVAARDSARREPVGSLEAALRGVLDWLEIPDYCSPVHTRAARKARADAEAVLVAAPSYPEPHPSEVPAATEDPADDPLIEEPMDYSPIGAREPSDEETVERVAKALYDSNGKQHGGYEDVPRRKGIMRYRAFEWEELAEEDKAGTRKHAAAAIAAFREPVVRGETDGD